jgi:hypothetical protein
MARIVIAMLGLGVLIGCNRHAHVREEMTWECQPGRAAQIPSAQPVLFRFVKNSGIAALHAAPGLCDQLQAAGKPIVTIDYEVWGNSVDGLHGFRALTIDGKSFKDLLPHEGGDSLGPNPLAAPFESNQR